VPQNKLHQLAAEIWKWSSLLGAAPRTGVAAPPPCSRPRGAGARPSLLGAAHGPRRLRVEGEGGSAWNPSEVLPARRATLRCSGARPSCSAPLPARRGRAARRSWPSLLVPPPRSSLACAPRCSSGSGRGWGGSAPCRSGGGRGCSVPLTTIGDGVRPLELTIR